MYAGVRYGQMHDLMLNAELKFCYFLLLHLHVQKGLMAVKGIGRPPCDSCSYSEPAQQLVKFLLA